MTNNEHKNINKIIKVKISTQFPDWNLMRQTPGSQGIWNNCEFYINGDTKECDWWVVFDGVLKEQTAICYPNNTILITGEPPSTKRYKKEFVRQFNTVITVQEKIKAPNVINLQLLSWLVGAHYSVIKNKFDVFTKGYDELKQMADVPKTKLISVISSSKTTTRGHRQRLKFIEILKEHFKERLDVFGSGINHIADKWDGIAPYKYHIVVENSVHKNYWTEKLADSFLSESYPFYFGCPNIRDYFHSDAISRIDINKPNEAIETIEKAVCEDYHKKFNQEVKDSKEKILDQYQIFPQLCKIINDSENNIKKEERVTITIKPEIIKNKNVILRILSKILKMWLLKIN